MKVRKFQGRTVREALRLVKQALGPDALILGSREGSFGVEVLATATDEMERFARDQVRENPPLRPAPHVPPRAAAIPVVQPVPAPAVPPARPSVAVTQPAGPSRSMPDVAQLAQEIRGMKRVLEQEIKELATQQWISRSPIKAEGIRLLVGAGFSVKTAQSLLGTPAAGGHGKNTLQTGLTHALRRLTNGPDPLEGGGVYALVGPTGAGKTTTIAKLAARAVLRHGAGNVALVSLDNYRIGAHEQLRIYGKLLGIPVHEPQTPAQLGELLATLGRERRVVLLDTVGMGQRDRRLTDQDTLLAGAGRPVRRLLLLNAASQLLTLEEVYQAYGGPGLHGVILSKLDEAASLGGVLDLVLRQGAPVCFVTNGQRVPEDLHRADPLYLADRAIRTGRKLASQPEVAIRADLSGLDLDLALSFGKA